MKLIYKSINNEMYRDETSILIKFNNKRAISSGFLNGGIIEDISAVFNYRMIEDNVEDLEFKGINNYLKDICYKYNVNPDTTTFLLTAAEMEKCGIKTLKYHNAEVTAIVTAGTIGNSGRAGDKASYYEENNNFNFEIGTINIILLINGYLSDEILVNALITATEAKSAILGDLRIPSVYSETFATGTGTDGVVIIVDKDSDLSFNNAGKHSKLGELISQSVIQAMEESIFKQMTITRTAQCDVLRRLHKLQFDINEFYDKIDYDKIPFITDLIKHKRKIHNVAITTSILNIIEEVDNQLITKNVAYSISKELVLLVDDYTVENLLDFVVEKYLGINDS